jgi:hypothetical protein
MLPRWGTLLTYGSALVIWAGGLGRGGVAAGSVSVHVTRLPALPPARGAAPIPAPQPPPPHQYVALARQRPLRRRRGVRRGVCLERPHQRRGLGAGEDRGQRGRHRQCALGALQEFGHRRRRRRERARSLQRQQRAQHGGLAGARSGVAGVSGAPLLAALHCLSPKAPPATAPAPHHPTHISERRRDAACQEAALAGRLRQLLERGVEAGAPQVRRRPQRRRLPLEPLRDARRGGRRLQGRALCGEMEGDGSRRARAKARGAAVQVAGSMAAAGSCYGRSGGSRPPHGAPRRRPAQQAAARRAPRAPLRSRRSPSGERRAAHRPGTRPRHWTRSKRRPPAGRATRWACQRGSWGRPPRRPAPRPRPAPRCRPSAPARHPVAPSGRASRPWRPWRA